MYYTPFSACVVILNVCCSTARREMATSKSLHTHTVNILKASTSLMLPRYITTCVKQNIHTLLPTAEFYPFLQLSNMLTLGMHEYPATPPLAMCMHYSASLCMCVTTESQGWGGAPRALPTLCQCQQEVQRCHCKGVQTTNTSLLLLYPLSLPHC